MRKHRTTAAAMNVKDFMAAVYTDMNAQGEDKAMKINDMGLGHTVEINHPFYGRRTVTVTGFDGPKDSTINDVGMCVIEGRKTWFDQEMVV